jgi:hypothetical protein
MRYRMRWQWIANVDAAGETETLKTKGQHPHNLGEPMFEYRNLEGNS